MGFKQGGSMERRVCTDLVAWSELVDKAETSWIRVTTQGGMRASNETQLVQRCSEEKAGEAG
eukprot:3882796-Pleurochrysis_carterae.AAC.1